MTKIISFEPRERDIQAAVVDHFRALRMPMTQLACVPNARAFGQAGLTRGLPDLVVLGPELPYGQKVGFIELKRRGGHLSEAQIEFRQLAISLGVPFASTFGRDEPIDILEAWRLCSKRAAGR
jgi:hypothetical protein